MTLHTDRAAGTSLLVGNTRVYRALVSMIVALTIMLTGWTAAQAAVVNNVLEGNGPVHPSIRQLERTAEAGQNARQHPSIRQVERMEQDLQRMEYNELRRFRNRAPASALPALDAEIERLRQILANES